MTLPFSSMDILDNTFGSTVLDGPVRALDIGRREGTETVWLIDLPRPRETKPKQLQPYLRGPYSMPLADLVNALNAKEIYGGAMDTDPRLRLKDQDLLKACAKERQKKRLQKSFDHRDERYDTLAPLILEGCGAVSKVPLAQLLQDESLPGRMAVRAKAKGVSLPTIYNWLHKYLVGGCQKNALLSNYVRVGNPGQPKAQRKKLGRSPQLFRDGRIPSRGYPISDDDKEKLAWGFGLISHSLPPRDSYLVTCMTFWAAHSLDARGKPQALMFEKHLRPTFAQFMRWGSRLREQTVTELLLGPTAWRQKTEARGGSEQDRVAAIGQEAMFDGTSTDVYLASCGSRLKKLPPMTRLILKESRLGIIYGLYCGWQAASPATALLAILNGAMPFEIKAKWALRFGHVLAEDQIPSLLARNHLADNGELKAHAVTEAEDQFGFGISTTPIGGGDWKGGVESNHRSMHVRLDKKLPGATHGKPRPRGQDHAAVSGLWNYYEYMSELIRLIVWHNTVQEVPHLAPDVMLIENPEIRPTRMNIYRWLTDRHMNVSLPVDYRALRAFTLTDVDAVIRKNGVYLAQKIHGRRSILLRLRYISPELVKTGLMSEVKRTGKVLQASLKMDRNDLAEAWLPTKAGMIPLSLAGRNESLRKKMTLDEWVLHLEEIATQKLLDAGATEQAAAEDVFRKMGITEFARQEAAAETDRRDKPVSKANLIRDLDKNRDAELELLRAHEAAQSVRQADSFEHTSSDDPAEPEPYSAVDAAMDAFLAAAVAI